MVHCRRLSAFCTEDTYQYVSSFYATLCLLLTIAFFRDLPDNIFIDDNAVRTAPKQQDKRILMSNDTDCRILSCTNSSAASSTSQIASTIDPLVHVEDLRVVTNVPVYKWVETVCGRDTQTIDAWADYFKQISLVHNKVIKKALKKFCSASYKTTRYAPLCRIIDEALELANISKGKMEGIDGPPPILDISSFPRDSQTSKVTQRSESDSHHADRMPDVIVARISKKTKANRTGKGVKWSAVIACIELEFVDQLKGKLKAER